MNDEEFIRVQGFIAALLAYDSITPEIIEMSVAVAGDLRVGDHISALAQNKYPSPMVRSFTREQARRLANKEEA